MLYLQVSALYRYIYFHKELSWEEGCWWKIHCTLENLNDLLVKGSSKAQSKKSICLQPLHHHQPHFLPKAIILNVTEDPHQL